MRLNLLALFLLKTVGFFIPLVLLWYHFAAEFTGIARLLADAVTSWVFPRWADGVESSGTTLVLTTTLQVHDVPGLAPGQIALLSPEVAFPKYGYGLPLLVALVLASKARHPLRKCLLGALALLPFQLWGVCFDWLMQVGIRTSATSFSPVTRELVALGYQFGYLVLPSLVPIVLWLMMDRRFFATLLLEATLEGGDEPAPTEGPRDGGQ